MKKQEIDLFLKCVSQLSGVYDEFSLLSKKSPDGSVNKFKLRHLNSFISLAEPLLTGEYKPMEGFDAFEEDDVPTNSDVCFVVTQYLKCLEKLRCDNISGKGISWHWNCHDSESLIITKPPTRH